MKRMLAVTLAILLAFSAAAAETAAMTEYSVESVGCSVSLPSDWEIEYKNMPEDVLASRSLSREEIENFLESNGLEIWAVSPDGSVNLQVYQYTAPLKTRLKDQDDVFLKAFLSSFIPATAKNLGTEITKSEIVKTDHNIYVRFEWELARGNDDKVRVITYYTTADALAREFYFFCPGTEEKDADRTVASVMDRVVWDFESEASGGKKSLAEVLIPRNAESASSARYEYAPCGVSFMIPDGWADKPLSGERETVRMKMAPADDVLGTAIMFGCTDIWGMLSAEERVSYGLSSRKDIDAQYMMPELLSQTTGVSEEDISFITLGDCEFGVCALPRSILGIEYEMIVATTFVDGVMIQFSLSNFNDAYLSTFAEVLRSMKVEIK